MKILLLAVVLFSSLQVYAADVRSANWGMTLKEVKMSERTAFLDSSTKDSLNYMLKWNSFSTQLSYYFNAQGKLNRIVFFINEKRTKNDEYFTDFTKLFKALKTEFGDNMISTFVWNKSADMTKYKSYTDETKKNLAGLYAGDGTLVNKWDKTRTEIWQMLSFEKNGRCSHFVRYISKTIK